MRSSNRWLLIPALIVLLACLRLAHANLLWADEDYHLAAAIKILHGKMPYRDFWYDKPPLSALFYVLIGGHAGWTLRMLGAGYVVLASCLAYLVARDWWGDLEGKIAAVLIAFSATFYLPSAVIPLAPDALMMVPHLGAVYFARRGNAVRAGVCAGLAFLVNIKGVFVLASCGLFLWSSLLPLAAGFAAIALAALGLALTAGAWQGFREQVWEWGLIYARNAPVINPWQLGLTRTFHWLGFHAGLGTGAAFLLTAKDDADGHKDRWQLAGWIGLSFIGVCLGVRFAPHYYFQLLPPMVIAASRGIVLAVQRYKRTGVVALITLFLIPAVRFGPRYVSLAVAALQGRDPRWTDIAMDLDSRRAAAKILGLASPGDTMFVWGYRPNLYVYTRLDQEGRFWDSQPLTAVPADRHLSTPKPVDFPPAAEHRAELTLSKPAFVIDGLAPFNPALAIQNYPDLWAWRSRYRLVDRTDFCLIYKRLPEAR